MAQYQAPLSLERHLVVRDALISSWQLSGGQGTKEPMRRFGAPTSWCLHVHALQVNPNLEYVCDPVMGDEGRLYGG